MKVATVALNSNDDRKRNEAQALKVTQEAIEAGAEWILLPEVLLYHGPYSQLKANAEAADGAFMQKLQDLAKQNRVMIVAGTVGEEEENDEKVYNTSRVIDREGRVVFSYRKTHLFHLMGDDGKEAYGESRGFLAGDTVDTFTQDGWRLGLGICYDLRFGPFFEALLAKGPCDAIFLPSAFTYQTGQAHWEVMLRSRAIEYQCYMIASNQVGDHGQGKSSYGHAMIITPWGEVIANTEDKVGFALANIEKEKIAEARRKLPALENRRPELYHRWSQV